MRVLLLLLLMASTAWAEERPLTTPTRDVDIVYVMAGPTEPMAQRLRWGIALGKLRVDPPSPGLFVIIDTASHAMQAVREGDRSVIVLPAGKRDPTGMPAGDSFARRGDSQVAGLACTDWETRDTAGRLVLACLTPDGVLLRVTADGLVLLQAAVVTFGPQPDELFRVPSDYRKIISPDAPRPAK